MLQASSNRSSTFPPKAAASIQTGERIAFALSTRLEVTGVVGEDRHDVLIDATDRSGARAWVRCDVRTRQCEVATRLGPDDVAPLH